MKVPIAEWCFSRVGTASYKDFSTFSRLRRGVRLWKVK